MDGAIGELSLFHETFSYYAHGVDENTAILPAGWKQRLVPLRNQNTQNATGWCLEVHDLAVSKLAAEREKDMNFVRRLIIEKMIHVEVVTERLEDLPLSSERLAIIRERLHQLKRHL